MVRVASEIRIDVAARGRSGSRSCGSRRRGWCWRRNPGRRAWRRSHWCGGARWLSRHWSRRRSTRRGRRRGAARNVHCCRRWGWNCPACLRRCCERAERNRRTRRRSRSRQRRSLGTKRISVEQWNSREASERRSRSRSSRRRWRHGPWRRGRSASPGLSLRRTRRGDFASIGGSRLGHRNQTSADRAARAHAARRHLGRINTKYRRTLRAADVHLGFLLAPTGG